MKIFLAILVLSVVTGMLHALWEQSHISLYTGYEKMEGVLPVWLFATLGDIAYTVGAVLFVGLSKGDALWILRAQPRDFLVLLILGFLMALFVEYKAFALGRWSYTEQMPIIPYLKVGFSPILQMSVLLPLSVFITKLMVKP